MHFCSVLNGTGRAHASVSHSGGLPPSPCLGCVGVWGVGVGAVVVRQWTTAHPHGGRNVRRIVAPGWLRPWRPAACAGVGGGVVCVGGGGGHGFPPFVKSIRSQQSRFDGTSLAVVYNVPLRSIALRVGALPTGTSVSHSCDRKVPMVL